MIPKTEDVSNLSDILAVFCFTSTKQGTGCFSALFPGLFPKPKVQVFAESLRQDIRRGRFVRAVDGCTTEQAAGENQANSPVAVQR